MQTVSLPHGPLAFLDRGRGQVVLLIHGFPLDHTMWNSQIEALASRYRVVAPDLRGFGQTPLGDIDPERGFRMEEFAEELVALLAALNITKPVVIVGFSMGGYIAWQLIWKHAGLVRALVQCDTRAAADNDEGRLGRLKMADHVAEWGSSRVAEMMGPKLFSPRAYSERPRLLDEIRQVVGSTSPAAIAAAQRGMAVRADVSALLPSIQVPTLIVVGVEDAISTRDEMRSIAASIPNASFVEIPQAGHMTTLEEPVLVNEALIRFLGNLRE